MNHHHSATTRFEIHHAGEDFLQRMSSDRMDIDSDLASTSNVPLKQHHRAATSPGAVAVNVPADNYVRLPTKPKQQRTSAAARPCKHQTELAVGIPRGRGSFASHHNESDFIDAPCPPPTIHKPLNGQYSAARPQSPTLAGTATAAASPRSSRRGCRKSVKFAPEEFYVWYDSDVVLYCPEDLWNLWYTSEDYKYFKKDRNYCVQEAIAMETEIEHDSRSYKNVMERCYQVFCNAEELEGEDGRRTPLTSHQHGQFVWWVCQTGAERLGLERAIAQGIDFDKTYRKYELYETVFGLQDDEGMAGVDRSELIAQVCQNISRPSRLFARHLGQAVPHSLVDEP